MKVSKEKTGLFIRIFIVTLIVILGGESFSAQKGPQPKPAPLNPEFLNPPSVNFGLMPHPADLSHLKAQHEQLVAVPAAWDWRSAGGVTSVKDQGLCGSCWAFATMGDLESLALIYQNKYYDFSEENLKECNYWGFDCASGGHAFGASNYLIKSGARLEACDPYHAYDTSCNTTCIPAETVTGWRILPNDASAIKSAVYQYGPCYTAMNASTAGFSSYDGSYVIYDPSCSGTNHAVLIVGWDDTMLHAGGSGAWIVKNSWGTTWGDNGYFYIAYGSACIGSSTSYYCSKKSYCSHDRLYYYDDAGWYSSLGWVGYDYAHGLAQFTPNEDDCITNVEFWAVDDNMTCDIYIYDNFNGTNLSNLLHSQTQSCPIAGYYSVELTSPVCVETGDDFFVDINFNCTGYNYPLPIDTFAPIESNKCYASLDGSSGTWFELGGSGWDLGIRARGGHRHMGMMGANLDGDGDDEVVADHGTSGVSYWNSPWNTITTDNPEHMIAADLDGDGDDEAIADFGPLGLWYWDGSWSLLTLDDPEYMIAANLDGDSDDELIADFGAIGLWSWNSSWSPLTYDNPEYMIVANLDGDSDDELIADFGAIGLWFWNTSWNLITLDNPEYMIAADLDGNNDHEVVGDFGTLGLWYWDGSWSLLTLDNPEYMIAADLDGSRDDEIVGDFGTMGLWKWDTSWSIMTVDNPEYMIAADLDGNDDHEVVADFSAMGLWNWNGSWTNMTADNPEYMIAADLDGNGDDEIVGDFSGLGFWYWLGPGSWISM